MKRLRHLRGLAMLPAVAWLLIQLSMTGVMAAPTSSLPKAADLGWSALGLHDVAICSPEGTITLDTGGQNSGRSMPSHCEWCQAFGSITAPPLPATVAVVDFHTATFRYSLAAARVFPETGIRTGFFGRAPPF